MKKLWYLSGLLGLAFVGHYFYGMQKNKRGIAETAPVEAYFVPQDNVGEKLISFLDNAEMRIYVAVYWILEKTIIDMFIELKRKGIDVQLIIDESSFKYLDLTQYSDSLDFITTLSNGGIIPIVYPSESYGIGFMHNKFVVVDNDDVFTGSANFTKRGLNMTENYNYENIVIIHSNSIAQKYKLSFLAMQRQILDLYINLIEEDLEIPDWLYLLLTILPREKFKPEQRTKLERFLAPQPQQPIQHQEQVRMATEWQKEKLIENGYGDEVEDMTYDEAYEHLAPILRGQRRYVQ